MQDYNLLVLALMAFGITVAVGTAMYIIAEIVVWIWGRLEKVDPVNLTEKQRAEWLYTRRVK